MRVRSPQEKKALSLVKDHRDDYRANDKASRKRVRQRDANRPDRRREHQALAGSADADVVATTAKPWRKMGDVPLAELVVRALRRRAATGMMPTDAAEAKIERVRSRRSGRD